MPLEDHARLQTLHEQNPASFIPIGTQDYVSERLESELNQQKKEVHYHEGQGKNHAAQQGHQVLDLSRAYTVRKILLDRKDLLAKKRFKEKNQHQSNAIYQQANCCLS